MVVIIFLAAKLLIILMHAIKKIRTWNCVLLKQVWVKPSFISEEKIWKCSYGNTAFVFKHFFLFNLRMKKNLISFFLSSFIQIDLSIMKTVTDRLSNMEPFNHVLLVSFFSHVMVCVTLQAQSNILSIPWIRN